MFLIANAASCGRLGDNLIMWREASFIELAIASSSLEALLLISSSRYLTVAVKYGYPK